MQRWSTANAPDPPSDPGLQPPTTYWPPHREATYIAAMPDAELSAELNHVVQLAVKVTGARLAFVTLGSGDALTVPACHGDALTTEEVHRLAMYIDGADDGAGPPTWLRDGGASFLAEPLTDVDWTTQLQFERGALCVVADRGHAWGGGDSAVVRRLAHLAAAQLRHHSRMTALVARERCAAVLASLAAQLVDAASEVDVVAATSEAARGLLDPSAATIALRSGEELQLTDLHGARPAAAALFGVLALHDANPISRCVVVNEAAFYGSPAALAEEFPHLADVAVSGGHRAYAVTPLTDGSDVYGAVAMMWDREHDLEEWERSAIRELGCLCGRTLARVEDVDDTTTLADIEGDLGAAPTVADVAAIVTDRASKLLGAANAQLAVVTGDSLELVASHAIPGREGERYRRIRLTDDHPSCVALRERRTIVIDDESGWQRWAMTNDTSDWVGAEAAVVVPFAQSGRRLGVLTFGFVRRADLGPRQRRLAGRLAMMAGRAVERAQLLDRTRELLERQRTITAGLQRSLLPAALPIVPGADLAAIYQPAEQDIHVGGDWYDAFVLADGRLMLTIGDVVGKGVDAAGASGQLRSAMRALADAGADAAQLVQRLDWFALTFPAAWAATTMCLIVDLGTGAVQVCRAGHIPPLIVSSDGTTRYHEVHGSPPLGVGNGGTRPSSTFQLDRGELLVLCTDGLVERVGVSLDVGLAAMAASTSRWPRTSDLAEMLSRLAAANDDPRSTSDDVCILALRRHA